MILTGLIFFGLIITPLAIIIGFIFGVRWLAINIMNGKIPLALIGYPQGLYTAAGGLAVGATGILVLLSLYYGSLSPFSILANGTTYIIWACLALVFGFFCKDETNVA